MTYKEWDRAQQEKDSTCGCAVAILAGLLLAIAATIYCLCLEK